MRLVPIIIPTSRVELDFQPLPPAVAQGGGAGAAMAIPNTHSVHDFQVANAHSIDRLAALGLTPNPNEQLSSVEAISLLAFDGPFLLTGSQLLRENTIYLRIRTAVVTRDAIGYLADGHIPIGIPDPQRLTLPILTDAQWWPLIWLRPSTSAHDDLLRVQRAQADIATIAQQTGLPLEGPVLGRIA